MRLTYSLLSHYLKNTDLRLKNWLEAFKMRGFEVDILETQQDGTNYVLEIQGSSNRGDCLSLVGIAREIGVLVGGEFIIEANPLSKIDESSSSKIENVSIEHAGCVRYAVQIIQGIHVGPSPKTLQETLKMLGFGVQNNVVDTGNFVMYEQGNPVHIFDLDKIQGSKLTVREGHPEETLNCLDGLERSVKNTLIISDVEKVLCIAGIIGGIETAVTQNTKNILIECAYFDPEQIRLASKTLAKETQASQRFTRGVDINNLSTTLDRCTQLLTNHTWHPSKSPSLTPKKQFFFKSTKVC